jgi:hypothetical protein
MHSDIIFEGLNAAIAIVDRDNWGLKQNDNLDQATKFIYYCADHKELEAKISRNHLDSTTANYARRRWVNFKRHDAWLEVILEVFGSDVIKNPDDFHKTEDLTISHLGKSYPFDLKVTVWSSRARELNIREYGQWLYDNQSRQQRFHLRPRLFVVARAEKDLYDHNRACRTIQELKNNFDQHLQSYVLDNREIRAVAIETL